MVTWRFKLHFPHSKEIVGSLLSSPRGLMKHKSYIMILLMIIIILFPSICFSKSKTVEGEYCDVYLGDMKNKKEFDDFKQTVKTKSIENGLHKYTDPLKLPLTEKCFTYMISKYLEKVVVVSHTDKERKICDKVRITLEPEVINKCLSQNICKVNALVFLGLPQEWFYDVDDVLTTKNGKINIGLIIETKIPDTEGNKRELLENGEESQFFGMIEGNKDKYKLVDRKHLKTIIDEQKLSSSGITDSETLKLGKILNLDIIVLRFIYEKSQVTKVLKVDTGEVLLFKTYKTEMEDGWVFYGTSDFGDCLYDQSSITSISPKIFKVWTKVLYHKVGKDKIIQMKKENNLSIDGYERLDYGLDLYELDCANNTIKGIKNVEYNFQGKILYDFDYQSPKINHILPGSLGERLRNKVCNN
jgi:hypothetical protein